MTILCEVDEPIAGVLAAAMEGRVLQVTSLSAAGIAMTADPGERSVVIGERVDLDEVITFTQHVRVDHPTVSIILLRVGIDAHTVEAAQRAGVHEVVTPSDIAAVVARLQHAEANGAQRAAEVPVVPGGQALRPRGRLITVFAAKGGCG